MAEMTEQEFADKISWEGGVVDALEWGLTPSQCEPGPLRDAYTLAWMIWDAAFHPAMKRAEILVREIEEFGAAPAME